MNTDKLAKVYFDNQPLELEDAKPKIEAILSASGKPKDTRVQWLQSRSDPEGKTMQPDEVVDRTEEPTTAIYLTSGEGGRFAQGDRGRDIPKGRVAPVPKGESALASKDPEGKSGKKPGQVGQKHATEKKPAGKKPARKQQPWTEESDSEDDAAFHQDD